jgi:hypothetical protein
MLPLHVLLFRCGRRLAGFWTGDNPHLIAIGEAVRRGGDDAIIGGDAGGESISRPRSRAMMTVLNRILSSGALVEDQRAGRDVQRRSIAPLKELQSRRTKLSKDCGASLSSEIG